MNDIHKVFVRAFAITVLMSICFGKGIAQGPPVFLDSCIVSGTMRFPGLPVPATFVPGSYETLRACPNLGNTVVKVAKVKAGKARNLRMELRMENGKLREMHAFSSGEKDFEKLYEQVICQAGIPSKMVESDGILTYSWDLRFRIQGHVAFHYDPALQKGTVIITP